MQKIIPLLVILVSVFGSANANSKSWYTYWGVGYSKNIFDQDLQDKLNDTSLQPNSSRISMGGDYWGFYWPAQNKSFIQGVVVSWAANLSGYDELENSIVVDNGTFSNIQYLYSYSRIYFNSSVIGKGLFYRGDIGVAKSLEFKLGENDEKGFSGVGGLLGVGYGIPVSDESRIMLGLNYSFKYISNAPTQSISFTLGGLW